MFLNFLQQPLIWGEWRRKRNPPTMLKVLQPNNICAKARLIPPGHLIHIYIFILFINTIV